MMQSGQRDKRFSRTRTSQEVPEPLQRRLHSYALAASAAGVTLLACSAPADAAPVCKTLNVSLTGSNTFALNPGSEQFAPFNVVQTFNNVSSMTLGFWNRGFFTPNSAKAVTLLGKDGLPAALTAGENIGPGGYFGKGKSYGLLFSYGPLNGGTKKQHQGNFDFGRNDNFFGYRFSISGKNHYGWVRLKVTFGPGFDGTATTVHVLGYGYESSPNTAIHAGECSESGAEPGALLSSNNEARSANAKIKSDSSAATAAADDRKQESASLGALALGASGLRLWRR